MMHLISVKDMPLEFIESVLLAAGEMKTMVKTSGGDDRLKHKVLTSMFFEASTRTNCSFQAAMLRLGGSVISVNESFSSTKKGETLQDTIKTLGCYSDVIVLRHPQQGSSEIAASVSTVPIINAGDGVGEHPTQSLLDLFTIEAEIGVTARKRVAGERLTVTFVGDLKHGRTVHSLVLLLSRYPNIRLVYIAPRGLEMPPDIVLFIQNNGALGVEQFDNIPMEEAVADTNVLYVTRIQRERFASQSDYEAVMGIYIVDKDIMAIARSERMILMHPMPRVDEISVEVDSDPRAAYFRQAENGMYVRMAILDHMLLRNGNNGGTGSN